MRSHRNFARAAGVMLTVMHALTCIAADTLEILSLRFVFHDFLLSFPGTILYPFTKTCILCRRRMQWQPT